MKANHIDCGEHERSKKIYLFYKVKFEYFLLIILRSLRKSGLTPKTIETIE